MLKIFNNANRKIAPIPKSTFQNLKKFTSNTNQCQQKRMHFFSTLSESSYEVMIAKKAENLVSPTVIAWDLDFTIWDCNPHYRLLINETRRKMNRPMLTQEELQKINYRSLPHIFDLMFGEQSRHAQECFYQTLEQSIPDQKLLMPNVLEALENFKNQNIQMIIVSNLEKYYAECFLKGFNIRHYFDTVFAKRLGQPTKPEPEALLNALKIIDVPVGKHVWLIGDSPRHDSLCALTAGATAVQYTGSVKLVSDTIESHLEVNSHREFTDVVTHVRERDLASKLQHKI